MPRPTDRPPRSRREITEEIITTVTPEEIQEIRERLRRSIEENESNENESSVPTMFFPDTFSEDPDDSAYNYGEEIPFGERVSSPFERVTTRQDQPQPSGVTCSYCGETTDANHILVLPDGDPVCISCTTRHFDHCNRCHELTLGNGDTLCPTCSNIEQSREQSREQLRLSIEDNEEPQSQPPVRITQSQPSGVIYSSQPRRQSPPAIRCIECDAVIPPRTSYSNYLGDPLCNNCRDEGFTQCADCDYLIRNRNITYAGERPVCRDCIDDYSQCDSCNEFVRRRNTFHDENITVCQVCFHDNMDRCHRCGQIFNRRDLTYDDDFDASFCDNCFPYRMVHQYGHTPDGMRLVGLRGEQTNLYFGIENEIIGGNINKYDFDLTHTLKFWETRDRSVDPGFEFKTYPFSYNYIVKNRPFDPVCEMAKNAGYVSDYTDKRSSEFITDDEIKKCGLHIHISRIAFDEYADKTRLHSFIYLFEKFWREVVIFSRRKHDFRVKGGSNSIDQWAARFDEFDALGYFDADPNSHNHKSFYRVVDRVLKRYDSNHQARRHVVNLENNNTVEVRIFQGSLDPNVILASIQLVKYFFELSLFGIPNLEKLNWYDIRQWAYEQYPEFSAYCDERGI